MLGWGIWRGGRAHRLARILEVGAVRDSHTDPAGRTGSTGTTGTTATTGRTGTTGTTATTGRTDTTGTTDTADNTGPTRTADIDDPTALTYLTWLIPLAGGTVPGRRATRAERPSP